MSILDDNQGYKFPEPFELELRLKDVLEDEVDEKYYLSQEQVDRITFSKFNQNARRIQEKDYSDTLCARDYKYPKVIKVGNVNPSGNGMNGNVYNENGVAPTVTTNKGEGSKVLVNQYNGLQNKETPSVKVEQIGQYNTPTRKNSSRYRVYDDKGVSPSLTTMGGGNLEPHVFEQRSDEGVRKFKDGCVGTIRATDSGGDKRVLIKNATKKGYIEASEGDGIDLSFPESKTRRGRVQKEISQTLDTGDDKGVLIGASRGRNPKNPNDRTVGSPTEQRLEVNKQGTSNTITTVQKDNYVVEPLGTIYSGASERFQRGLYPELSRTLKANNHDTSVVFDNFRIRKLTPLECWRLMGISDEDFYKAQKVNSNTQLYKQAGNAIVVDVLEGIFRELFYENMLKCENGGRNERIK